MPKSNLYKLSRPHLAPHVNASVREFSFELEDGTRGTIPRRSLREVFGYLEDRHGDQKITGIWQDGSLVHGNGAA